MTNERPQAPAMPPPPPGHGQVPSRGPSAPDPGAATVFEGAVGMADALAGLLARAGEGRSPRLCWCDDDYAAWPLGRAAWVEGLTRWMQAGAGELVMVAASYQDIERLHPRFVRWRRDWSHRVRCLVPDQAHEVPLPTLWLDDRGWALRVFDRPHWRGRVGVDRVDRQRWREEFDAIVQRATPGFASDALGL